MSSLCRSYSCKGKTAKILAGLGSKGFESKGCSDIEREIQPKIKIKPSPTREPLIRSVHANALMNSYLKEALHSLQNQTMEKVKTQSSLAFYNCSCSQTQPKVMAHLGTQYLKSVLKDQNFQNGTPESIRLSLQEKSGSLH